MLSYILLLGIGFIWGSQFLFTQMALVTMSPMTVAASRIIIGAMTLILLVALLPKRETKAAFSPIKLSWVKTCLWYAAIALFEAIIPFFSMAWGQQYVASSIAAVLVSTVPIFTAIFVGLLIRQEPITFGVLVSVIGGFIGILILFWPSLQQIDVTQLIPQFAILLAAASFALALVLIRLFPEPVTPLVMTRNVLGFAAIPFVIYLGVHSSMIMQQYSWASFIAVMVLGIFCSGLVYMMYVTLIYQQGASFAALSNYFVPLFGAVLGVIILNEPLHARLVIALLVVFIALGISRCAWLSKPLFSRQAER